MQHPKKNSFPKYPSNILKKTSIFQSVTPILAQMLFVVPLLYAAVVFYLVILMVKKRTTVQFNTAGQKLPGISIVIPFRNEAGNLPGLIASLDEQTYAGDFEIVLVNDGSTDNFHKAIGSRSEAKSGSNSQPLNRPLPQLRVINSPPAPTGRLTSKQRALF